MKELTQELKQKMKDPQVVEVFSLYCTKCNQYIFQTGSVLVFAIQKEKYKNHLMECNGALNE
jgi:hypothetical protein